MSSENSELPKFTLTKEFFPNKSFNVQAKLWRVKLCTQCSVTHQKRAPCLIDGSDLPSGCWGVPQGLWKNSSYPVSHLSSPWRVNFFNHFWGRGRGRVCNSEVTAGAGSLLSPSAPVPKTGFMWSALVQSAFTHWAISWSPVYFRAVFMLKCLSGIQT